MARFFGSVQGRRGEATRLGDGVSGLTVTAAGWHGAIEVRLTAKRDAEKSDEFEVILKPWGSSAGGSRVIASGKLDSCGAVHWWAERNTLAVIVKEREKVEKVEKVEEPA